MTILLDWTFIHVIHRYLVLLWLIKWTPSLGTIVWLSTKRDRGFDKSIFVSLFYLDSMYTVRSSCLWISKFILEQLRQSPFIKIVINSYSLLTQTCSSFILKCRFLSVYRFFVIFPNRREHSFFFNIIIMSLW